jgi:hypothetical protein
MKKMIKISGVVGAGLVVIFSMFIAVSGFAYFISPFYSSCLDLSVGMNKEEINLRMQEFLNSPNYKVSKETSGRYGWLSRLSYDDSLTMVLDKEPWYKLDQHPWQCKIDFKDGFVINIEPFFD